MTYCLLSLVYHAGDSWNLINHHYYHHRAGGGGDVNLYLGNRMLNVVATHNSILGLFSATECLVEYMIHATSFVRKLASCLEKK